MIKGIIKPQPEDKLFMALDEVFEIPKQNVSQETSAEIISNVLSKIKGGG